MTVATAPRLRPAIHLDARRSVSADEAWDLVDDAQAGDVEAFGALYRAHFDEILGLLTVRTRDWSRAEELASETFLRAFRQIRTLTYRGSAVRAWLMTIAKNLALDDLKSARRRREVLGIVPDDPAADGLDPAAIACARTTAAQLWGALTSLTPDQRACVRYRYLDELTVCETADRMGRSAEAVRALQLRALRRLAEVLDASGGVRSLR